MCTLHEAADEGTTDIGDRGDTAAMRCAALESLDQLTTERHSPFDLIFIDADTINAATYFARAVPLTRRSGLIVTDNVVHEGTVIEEDSADAMVQAVRRFNAMVAAEPSVSATVIQTVGRKGYDGMALAVVVAE